MISAAWPRHADAQARASIYNNGEAPDVDRDRRVASILMNASVDKGSALEAGAESQLTYICGTTPLYVEPLRGFMAIHQGKQRNHQMRVASDRIEVLRNRSGVGAHTRIRSDETIKHGGSMPRFTLLFSRTSRNYVA
jgi:hypothetical protein